MPFILITGIPCSGKTLVTNSLKTYFEGKGSTVKIISESHVLEQKKLGINTVYASSKIEKEIRGILRSEYVRDVSADNILILDGLNYIKGFRYELYCASKTTKTTHCTIQCDPGPERAWSNNLQRDEAGQYSKEVFDGLLQRYEPPDSRNRWDAPLFIIVDPSNIPFEDIFAALMDRKPPPPNQSTQCPPLSDTNFLHHVDKSVQAIITDITAASKLGREGEIQVTGSSERFLLHSQKNVSLPHLLRLKRQFLVYVKSHPELEQANIPTFFVQYINTNL